MCTHVITTAAAAGFGGAGLGRRTMEKVELMKKRRKKVRVPGGKTCVLFFVESDFAESARSADTSL